jgi:DNA-binding IclR family transcriptional regulator
MYDFNQWSLSQTISSEARFRILQILTPLSEGMGLRELERATELGIRSVQVATEGLIREKILIKNKNGCFQLNRTSELFSVLKKIFLSLRDERLRARAQTFSNRAAQVIRLSDQVANFVKIGKPNR